MAARAFDMTPRPHQVRTFALVLCALFAIMGCRAGPVQPVELGLSLSPSAIEFGRVREGATANRTLDITNISKITARLTLSTAAPFGAVASLTIGPTETVPLTVSFLAADALATGVLSITTEKGLTEVPLSGTGVHPLDCTPSAICRTSVWDLESGLCVESVSPDGASCDPNNQCIEGATCQSGVCLGAAKTCDDHDACTVDACSATGGCMHPKRVCPRPANPCHVATCDPLTGCGEDLAPDFTACGEFSCVSQRVCLSGTCGSRSTPDGFPCAPPTPCHAISQCLSHVCVKPPAMPLERNFRQTLPAPWSSNGRIIGADNALYFSGCGGAFDGGCGVTSFTSTGFERFSTPWPGPGEPQVLAASSKTMVVRSPTGLALLSATTGVARDFLPADDDPEARRFVLLDEFQATALQSFDGGTRLVVRGDAGEGVWLSGEFDALAADEQGQLFAFDADGGRLVRVAFWPDGGIEQEVRSAMAGSKDLALGAQIASLGSGQFQYADGGFRALPATWLDGGARNYDARSVLISDDVVSTTESRCQSPVTPCPASAQQRVLAAWEQSTLDPLWEVPLFDAGFPATVLSLVRSSLAPGASLATIDASTDAGVSVWLLGYAEGTEVFRCEVPTASPPLASLLYRGSLIIVRGFDAGSVMESYSLQGIPLSEQGWPQANGVAGSRRAR